MRYPALVAEESADHHPAHVLLALNLRRLTEARGISLAAVADRSGIDRRELFAVMAGEVDPGLDWLNQLADGLGVRLSALFDEPADPPSS